MEITEFCVLRKHFFLIKKNTVEAQAWLDEHYSSSAPSYSTIKFRHGEMSTEDAELKRGRPKEAVTNENIEKVHHVILNDHKVKLSDIADTVKITSEHVHHIIYKHLGMRSFALVMK